MAMGVRARYEAEVMALAEEASRLLASGASDEMVARWVVGQRNALKQRYRMLTPAEDRARLEAWTLQRYGNPLGPSADQLHDAGKPWRAIIEGACRPGTYRGAP